MLMTTVWPIILILNFISLVALSITNNFILIILFTLLIFFNMSLILFSLGLELMPLLILLVVLGALLILIIFALFILNQKNILERTAKTVKFYPLLILFIIKIFYFFSSLKFYSFTQIWLINLINEKESLIHLYSLENSTGYGPFLIIIGILLLCVTIGVSLIFKK